MLSNQQPVIFLVEERNNPSTEYFIAPALSFNNYRIKHFDFATLPEPEELAQATVVFVRYVPSTWAKLIDKLRDRIKTLIFFMDDDVLDFSASSGMPLRYRYKLASLSTVRINWLKRQKVDLWVSTPFLQQKYASWQPKLVLPHPVDIVQQTHVHVFYHGSPGTHRAEIKWLHPVMKKVMAEDDKISFELMGGVNINKQYRDINKISVLHPMRWPTYQNFISSGTRQIGLAPQLNIPFNHARSYTKFFDIHRCGAVGIFSPDSAISEIVNHNNDGLIVKLDQDAWIEAILKLANDESLRKLLFDNAKNKILQLKTEAEKSYAGLFNP
ncbi:MAG: glycosyltransferase family 1 protein [Methylococcaceae bacterium]|nr:glycosyltransferase family 1 protein [Methylococcaceae bacterium]